MGFHKTNSFVGESVSQVFARFSGGVQIIEPVVTDVVRRPLVGIKVRRRGAARRSADLHVEAMRGGIIRAVAQVPFAHNCG